MIKYTTGDLFKILLDNPNVVHIPHICNNKGGWGRGFVLSVSKFSQTPEQVYRSSSLELGYTQHVKVSGKVYVHNMIAQSSYGSIHNPVPLRYSALVRCMENVRDFVLANKGEIYAPKFGTGLASGKWELIERLIDEIWIDCDIKVTIFEH